MTQGIHSVNSPSFTLTDMWAKLIDITNACPGKCVYCSRFERHYRPDQIFYMSLEQVGQALKSYQDAPGYIVLIGGEPIVHPQLAEICWLCSKYFPREKLQFFTARMPMSKWLEHEAIINQTFGRVYANDHTIEKKARCKHQPTTLAVGEVCDPELANELIDNCWVPRAWCATVNHKGAFFCELAAALDVLLDGPGGWPVEPGWWRRGQADCKEQRDRYCHLCGMCLPYERQLMADEREKFTPKLLELYKQHNLTRLSEKDVEVVDLHLTREQVEGYKKTWAPWDYFG